jgi:hypothetical protein
MQAMSTGLLHHPLAHFHLVKVDQSLQEEDYLQLQLLHWNPSQLCQQVLQLHLSLKLLLHHPHQ